MCHKLSTLVAGKRAEPKRFSAENKKFKRISKIPPAKQRDRNHTRFGPDWRNLTGVSLRTYRKFIVIILLSSCLPKQLQQSAAVGKPTVVSPLHVRHRLLPR